MQLSDLLSAAALEPGMQLIPRQAKFSERVGVLLPDGQIEIDGRTFSRPSAAAIHITGHAMNGWWFFLVDPKTKRSLKRVRSEYIDSLDVDLEDEEGDEGDDDDA